MSTGGQYNPRSPYKLSWRIHHRATGSSLLVLLAHNVDPLFWVAHTRLDEGYTTIQMSHTKLRILKISSATNFWGRRLQMMQNSWINAVEKGLLIIFRPRRNTLWPNYPTFFPQTHMDQNLWGRPRLISYLHLISSAQIIIFELQWFASSKSHE